MLPPVNGNAQVCVTELRAIPLPAHETIIALPSRDLGMLKILVHVVALAVLYLVVSGAMFLGLRVDPFYGNIRLVVSGVLVALYVYVGFVRK